MARLAVVADLHVDYLSDQNRQDLIPLLVDRARQERWDLLVIAGDIADHHSKVLTFLDQVRQALPVDVYFIPGNHDYWSQDEDTWSIYRTYRDHPQCLIGRPLVLNSQWALVGHSLWYDHSASRQAFSEAFLDRGVYQGYRWEDKLYVRWQQSDRQVSDLFADQLRRDLDQAVCDQAIVVTHFVTHPGLQIPDDPAYQESINYFNAFISTAGLASIYQDYPIGYSLMGHVHHRKQVVDQDRIYATCCLGTEREWAPETTLASNLDQAIYRLDLDG